MEGHFKSLVFCWRCCIVKEKMGTAEITTYEKKYSE